jgi:asparagine synthase (glutamine-hydrolysing)
MCGIAGILGGVGRPVRLEEVRSMCAALVHRGPDDEGIYLDDGVGLGMRRLSIIDLETGRQPVRNEDGTIWAVLNGEIYNYQELRRDLEGRGHVFKTSSDTETVVHLYEEHGTDCVVRMRGMFALALWDQSRRRLLLARDRLGIKPLHYAEAGGRLVFASELKAILSVPAIERRLGWPAVGHLLTSLTTPIDATIVEGVRKLEPGHRLIATPEGGLRIERYWDLRFEPDRRLTEADCAARLRDLVHESVRLHLASDVPLGAFLSGGVDSSAVVATMARLQGRPVKTFSIGFAEGDFDELPHARRVAERFGTEHHELVLRPDAIGVLDDLVWHLDEPFGDPSAIPTYMVSKLAAEQVTVVLTGDGGDELFAGYDKYAVEGRERRCDLLPEIARGALGRLSALLPDGVRGRNLLRHLALGGDRRYLDAATLFRGEDQARLLLPAARERMAGEDPWRRQSALLAEAGGHWRSALQLLDLKTYLPLDILTKVDRMSMAHSLEARVPFLDHRLVEFAATIPPELALRRGVRKRVLKRAFEGILPREILGRRKQGFAVPLGRWFRGRLDGFARDLLLSESSRRRGILNPAYVGDLLDRQRAGAALDWHLWTLISLELWCRTFLDGAARPEAGRAARHRLEPLVVGPAAGAPSAAAAGRGTR